MICAACGHEASAAFKFCPECGAPANVEAAAREERKVVTVLFADLVGFTARAEAMDPEDVRALLAPYHARLREELERYGGTVEKFIGDAVMALFGAPVAHEDDPERALRAAIAIRDWAIEEDLEVRIAVNTGEALVALGARPEVGEGMASGDVVNTTARLQAAAPVNGILAGEATYRATRDVIDYRELDAVAAKGKRAPIRVWEAISPRSELGVDVVQAGRTPLIGRDQELTLLLNTAQRVRDEREPQLVTLIGVPGIGKSRLTFELFSALDDVVWRQGRCLPYGDGVAFWAIGEIVKSHAEIFEGDPAERAEAKLARLVSKTIDDESEREWFLRHLRPLVGIGAEATTGRDGQAEALVAWRRFFEAIAQRGPLVLVVEDLHWADEQLLEFVDDLVDWATDVPLLLVCTSRPELLERRPDWGGGKPNATTLSLRPLSDDDTARVLAANLQRRVLEAGTQRLLLERAGGNPLYAEQYARMIAERADPDELGVPETVQAIVAARLDGLSAEDKDLLHSAAVHGKVFWSGAVAAMTAADRSVVEKRLHALERREFVRRQHRTAVAGEVEYAFRHMLMRDVAYAQIPRRDRVDKHRLAAEWIDSLVQDRDDHVELLADHYARALELARATDGDVTMIAERARFAFRDAGARAVTLGVFPSALKFFRQALELWPDDDDRPYLLLELAESRAWTEGGQAGTGEAIEARDVLLALGDKEKAARAEDILSDIAFYGGHMADAAAHAERAVELVQDLPASRAKVHVFRDASAVHFNRGEVERALTEAYEMQRVAEEIGSDEERAGALDLIGDARLALGDVGGLADLERCLTLARELGGWWAYIVESDLAWAYVELGRLDQGFSLLAEAREHATGLGNRSMLAGFDMQRAREHYWRGEWNDALSLADRVLVPKQNLSFVARLHALRGQIRLARDQLPEAVDDSVKALEAARIRGSSPLDSALAVHTRTSSAVGEGSDALAAFDELLERFAGPETHLVLSGSLAEFARAAVELDRGEECLDALAALKNETPWVEAARAFAQGDLDAAAAVYAEIGSKPDAAYAWLCAGTDESVRRALEFYRSVGATRYIGEAEALLAAAS